MAPCEERLTDTGKCYQIITQESVVEMQEWS